MKINQSIKEMFLTSYRLDKKVNKYLVFESIREKGPLSIPEIANITKLSRPTIDSYIKFFHEKGFIKKEGLGDPQGGRKPNLWKLNNHAGYIIGVDMESPSLNLLLTDLDLNIISTSGTTFSLSAEKEEILEILSMKIHEMIMKNNIDPIKLVGIGIGIPGLIDKYRGMAVSIERIPSWRDVPLEQILKEEFHTPIFIENDVMLMAIAEKTLNNELKEEKNLIYIGFRYPSGIAARFFIDGRPYNGFFGNAGFLGHLQVEKDGPTCTCGKIGCLELFSDVRSMLNRVKENIQRGTKTKIRQLIDEKEDAVTLEIIKQAAMERDGFAINIFRDAAEYLSLGIEYLVTLFDIPLIILGGSITEAGTLFLDLVKEASQNRLTSIFKNNLDIRYGHINENVASLGGALLVYKDIFKEPVIHIKQ